jgi:hypothetical protein
MQEHILRPNEEWGGHKPSKFLPSKKHIIPTHTSDPQYKQIFDSKGRKHHFPDPSGEMTWKPSVAQVDFAAIHELTRPSAKAIVEKGRFEV